MSTNTEMDLETARRIISEHRDAEARAKEEENKKYVGRFFKYRNCYSGGDPSWWLYGTVVWVEEFGRMHGITFQERPNGIEVNADDSGLSTIVSANTEITAEEFWVAAREIAGKVSRLLIR